MIDNMHPSRRKHLLTYVVRRLGNLETWGCVAEKNGLVMRTVHNNIAVMYAMPNPKPEAGCWNMEPQDMDSQDMGPWVPVKTQYLQETGMTLEELDATAAENERKSLTVLTMQELFTEWGMFNDEGNDPGIHACHKKMDMEPTFHIITNTSRWYGACALLHPEIFKELAEKEQSDLVILPSSTHEVIAVPVQPLTEDGTKYFNNLVHNVNRNMVQKADQLADTIFSYARSTGKIVPVSISEKKG